MENSLFKKTLEQTPRANKIGRFLINEEIGRGGMGVVYKAHDEQLARTVAIKSMLSRDNKKNVQRFIREAKAIAKLDHPNIVKIYDIDEQQCYFAMDFIEGVSLKEYLVQNSFSIRYLTLLMVKIARAIFYAHSHKIIHRDLKPSNVMMDKNHVPHIMDFGLAKFTNSQEELTEKGAIMGTPAYMAPEQAMGAETSHLTDVYALGAIFYEMLTNSQVVYAPTVAMLLYNIIHQDPVPLCKQNEKVAKKLEVICHKAIAKKPEQRYQTVKAFAEDLERFLHGECISAKPMPFHQRAWLKVKYHRYKIAIAALFLLLGSIFGHFFLYRNTHQKIAEFLQKSQKLWQKKSLEAYMQADVLLSKALELSPGNNKIKTRLLNLQKKLFLQALEQREFFLVQMAITKTKRLGYRDKSLALERFVEKQQKTWKKNHQKFIEKAMADIAKKADKEILEWHAFHIIKTNKPYVVAMLAPYLQSTSKWQCFLAIQALGKLGNTFTKVKGKDSVELLMGLLQKSTKDEQKEAIINSLGWLQDPRSNALVTQVRKQAGRYSILWEKTRVPYQRIPLGDFQARTASEYHHRGQMYHMKGKPKKALADFDKSISLDPTKEEVYVDRGIIYKGRQRRKAMQDLEKAIALNPGYEPAYYFFGEMYFHQKKLGKALAAFSQAIRLNPNKALLYMGRGNTLYKQNKIQKALHDYNKAIALNPQYVPLYVNRGNAYKALRNIKRAIEDYNKAIALNANHVRAYMQRGILHQQLKQKTKAMADYDRAIFLSPQMSILYYHRARLYHMLKDVDNAIKNYSLCVRFKANASAYCNRGSLRRSKGDIKGAVSDFDKAITLAPKDGLAYYNKGNVYLALNKKQLAIKFYNRSIRLSPKYAPAYFNRARASQSLKNYAQARRDFQLFLKLAPRHKNAPWTRAFLRKHQK